MANDNNFTIALVGAGNMGGAMLEGWLADDFSPELVTIIDPSPIKPVLDVIDKYKLGHHAKPPAGLQTDVVLVALKPQIMDGVLPSLSSLMADDSVAVSIAAGKTLAGLGAGLGDCAIIRAMPNTPAQVRRGVSVCVANDRVSERQQKNVTTLLKSIGLVEWIADEALIDAVTGLSGSGPAYVFHLAEAMAAAGVEAGLPEALAGRLARSTVSGAGELMHQSSLDPAQLRRNVTSPNGTTQAGLEVLMGDDGLRQLMIKAVGAATARSKELAE